MHMIQDPVNYNHPRKGKSTPILFKHLGIYTHLSKSEMQASICILHINTYLITMQAFKHIPPDLNTRKYLHMLINTNLIQKGMHLNKLRYEEKHKSHIWRKQETIHLKSF